MKFYLAGPVGYGTPGPEWKAGMKDFLRTQGHEVYDPIENDHKYPLVPLLNKLKAEPKQNHQKIKAIMQQIFADDCRYITDCDYLICYFCGRSLGTAGEQTLAYYLALFLEKKVKTINIFAPDFKPDEWTICCSDFIFFSIEDCVSFLRKEFKSETLCCAGR